MPFVPADFIRPAVTVTVLTALTLAVPSAPVAWVEGVEGIEGVAGAATALRTDCQTFPQTGRQVCGRFLTYWQEHGGLAQQGYPISNQFQEASEVNGKTYTVQYFERAVFELHPENSPPYDVLLSLLGAMRYKEKYPGGAPELPPDMVPGAGVFFPQTGKAVRGVFLDYWRAHGGLMQQGYPISNLMRERSELDGREYTVQYFERAVFELHPENPPPYTVLLAQLGAFRFKQKYPNGEPVPPAGTLRTGVWGGQGISMSVTANGATIEYDCAHGTIDGPIVPDAGGRFEVTGTHVFERGGPVREGEPEDRHPARYIGVVGGDTLTITVTVIDQNRVVGTFTLTYGRPGRIVRCL
jgi:hypothetical protein